MSRSAADHRLRLILAGFACLAGGFSLLVVLFLVVGSFPALFEIGLGRFLLDRRWQPSVGSFGIMPMVAATFLLAFGALAIAVPFGVSGAVFCRFYAPSALATVYRRLLELLAGVPSVVYGFWGLVSLAPLIRELRPPGQSLLTGCLVLALMIMPTVALVSDIALRAVPRTQLAAAVALGMGRWAIVRGVVVPMAGGGIGAGVVLAAARAIGETMAVVMVTGNVVQLPASVFEPVRALTSNIALEMAYATDLHRSALIFSGLILMVAVSCLIAITPKLGSSRCA